MPLSRSAARHTSAALPALLLLPCLCCLPAAQGGTNSPGNYPLGSPKSRLCQYGLAGCDISAVGSPHIAGKLQQHGGGRHLTYLRVSALQGYLSPELSEEEIDSSTMQHGRQLLAWRYSAAITTTTAAALPSEAALDSLPKLLVEGHEAVPAQLSGANPSGQGGTQGSAIRLTVSSTAGQQEVLHAGSRPLLSQYAASTAAGMWLAVKQQLLSFKGAAEAALTTSVVVPFWVISLPGPLLMAISLLLVWQTYRSPQVSLEQACDLEAADAHAAAASRWGKTPMANGRLAAASSAAAELPDRSPLVDAAAVPAAVQAESSTAQSATSSQDEPADHNTVPPKMDVDISVRLRDRSKRSWVATGAAMQDLQAAQHGSCDGSLRGGSKPLLPDDSQQDVIAAGSCRTHPADGATEEPAAFLQQAHLQLAADASTKCCTKDANDCGHLTAAHQTADSTDSGNNTQAATPLVCRGSQVSESLQGQQAAQAACHTQRKLTAARTVTPQDLIGLGLSYEASKENSDLHSDPALSEQPAVPPQFGLAAGSFPAVQPAADALSRSIQLLSPQQLQDGLAVIKLLGAGASATVYAARWQGLEVAVKMLHPTNADAPAFAREVGILAAMPPHPCIVRILAACLQPPMAMMQELAPCSLHEQLHIRRSRPQYGLLLQLAEDVASALQHCHAQQPPIVHRDLSMRNVLLGFDGRAKLADFGLSVAKARTFLSTDKAGVLGTVAFMAPECMQASNVTERCDVFSYGVLLWELMTGRPAWEECSSPMQIIFAVGVERRRLPIPPGCPGPIARLLGECWRHTPSLRPSFTEVLARLQDMRLQDSLLQAQGLHLAKATAAQHAQHTLSWASMRKTAFRVSDRAELVTSLTTGTVS